MTGRREEERSNNLGPTVMASRLDEVWVEEDLRGWSLHPPGLCSVQASAVNVPALVLTAGPDLLLACVRQDL